MEDVHIIDAQRTKKRQKYTLWCMYITLLLDQIYHCVNEVQLLFFWIITNFPYFYMYLLHCIERFVSRSGKGMDSYSLTSNTKWYLYIVVQRLDMNCDFLILCIGFTCPKYGRNKGSLCPIFLCRWPNELFNKVTIWILLFPPYYSFAPHFIENVIKMSNFLAISPLLSAN
jgi:hypothetical protein